MRICELTALEVDDLERRGIRPNCRTHGHLIKTDAFELIKKGTARWVGTKLKAVTAAKMSSFSTRLATERGYDLAAHRHDLQWERVSSDGYVVKQMVRGGRLSA